VTMPVPRAACAPDASRVVTIGCSAGGLAALTRVLAQLPAGFQAAVLVVQHVVPNRRSMLAEILGRHTALKVKPACSGERLSEGTVYLAPPDRHLLVDRNLHVRLSQSARVHFVRPSVDRTFASVAQAFRDHAIAVVLTGSGTDGSEGVIAIKQAGGTVIAQDEATSEYFGMPSAAIRTTIVDRVLPLDSIAEALSDLVSPEDP